MVQLTADPEQARRTLGAVPSRCGRSVDAGVQAVRTTCTVGLTVDHRAADGADAARLLADLRALVADPRRLLG